MLARIAGGGGPFLNGLGADVGIRSRPMTFRRRLRGIGHLGDDSTMFDVGGALNLPSLPAYTPPVVDLNSADFNIGPAVSNTPGSPSMWDQLAVQFAKTAGTIATNVTRPAGLYQVTGPGGQTVTYQMPTTGPAAGLTPGLPLSLSLGGAGGSNLLIWGGIGLAALLVVGSLSKR